MMKEIPEQYAFGNSEYDAESAYWKFRSLFSIADSMGKDVSDEVGEMWRQYEEDLFSEHVCFAGMILESSRKQEKYGLEKLAQNYSAGILLRTAQAAEDKRKELLTKMAIGQK
ncbi:MAG: hypothetical protein IJ733_00775 [Lachnospiraceae bacterium]|nr:hypothetical protein [Lachnospiraceae bacterium]